jgi:hypothetical protein
MLRLVWLFRLIPLLLSGAIPAVSGCSDASGSSLCCKVCSLGKACGDSCINASETCHTAGGCACNG